MATKRTTGTTKKRSASKRRTRSAKIVEPKGITAPAYDAIAAKAHEIWIAEGCPEGKALEHWHEAEAKLTLMVDH